jgi:hypothetical protein
VNLGPPVFEDVSKTMDKAEFIPPLKMKVGENNTYIFPNVIEPDGD